MATATLCVQNSMKRSTENTLRVSGQCHQQNHDFTESFQAMQPVFIVWPGALLMCCCADLLIPLAAKMAEEPFKLLIMDSITANLRVDFSGRGELADRQQKLGQMMARLRKVRLLPSTFSEGPELHYTFPLSPSGRLCCGMHLTSLEGEIRKANVRQALAHFLPWPMPEIAPFWQHLKSIVCLFLVGSEPLAKCAHCHVALCRIESLL